MSESAIVGLASWIIQDGNFRDIKHGDAAAFALGFHAPRGLLVAQVSGHKPSLDHLQMATGPFIKADAGCVMRDPERLVWQEIDATEAWQHGTDYILQCAQLQRPPKKS